MSLLISLLMVVGQSAPTGADPQRAAPAVRLVCGSEHVIQLKADEKGTVWQYHGTLVAVHKDKLVVRDPVLRIELSRSPAIPLIGRFFRTKEVGYSSIKGNVSIERPRIALVHLVNKDEDR